MEQKTRENIRKYAPGVIGLIGLAVLTVLFYIVMCFSCK